MRAGRVDVSALGRWSRPFWSGAAGLALGCANAAAGGAGETAAPWRNSASVSCRVVSEHVGLEAVSVDAGAARLSLRLTDARVSALMVPGRALVTLRVEAPLVFESTYALRALDVRTTRAVALGGGITVGRGVRPRLLDARGDALIVSLADELGLELQPSPELPCDALALAPEGARHETPARRQPPNARFASLDPAGIALHATPGGDSAWQVRHAGPIERVGSEGGWFRIRAEWEGGSALDGWTPAPPRATQVPWPGVIVDGVSMPRSCNRTDQLPTFEVLARAGAPVFATPGGAAWAHFPAATLVEAQGDSAGGWLYIEKIPGIAADGCEHWFWMRAADVSEPMRR